MSKEKIIPAVVKTATTEHNIKTTLNIDSTPSLACMLFVIFLYASSTNPIIEVKTKTILAF